MAGKNLCKVIVLLLPATITVGLLSFCLISDWWIGVDEVKLAAFKQAQDKAFEAYLGGGGGGASDVDVVKIERTVTTKNKISPTTKSTTIATTTTTTKKPTTNDDDDYGNGGMYDDETSSSSSSNDTLNYDAMENEESQEVKKLKKRQVNSKEFVYVTKLWPMIKSKSLYSECVRYEKLTFRMSLSYLNLSNKEPISGTIHYGNDLISNSSSGSGKANEQCKGRVGMISCLLSNECVQGTICDGIVDCDDNTDEQFCDAASQVCHTANGGFQCDNKCYQYWQKCDQTPQCLNLSDELSNACAIQQEKQAATRSLFSPDTFMFGLSSYDYRHKCFRTYFNFKSPRLVEKDNLKYLTQSYTDKLQATNVMNYHLHLIYAMALLFAFVFSVLALVSLLFMVCLQKSCIQCPFWFYGFFEILTWLACSFGLMTFLAHKAYANNSPMGGGIGGGGFPFEREIYAQNKNFPDFQIVGVTFWIAVAANGVAFLASVLSCIFCCRLPSPRHENKEYKIMQLPTYN